MNIENTIRIGQKSEPVLLDTVLQDVQAALTSKLSWLNYAFGRAYKITEFDNDFVKAVYPAVYNANGEYLSVLPNDNFGNFSWFDIYDPQQVEVISPRSPRLIIEGAIIFWINMSLIYPDSNFIYSEELKKEILSVLTTSSIITSSIKRLEVKQVYERFENIYRGYSIEKLYNEAKYTGKSIEALDRQYFMYPYTGLRFEFKIITQDMCL